jgi:hypothetical protein
VRASVLVDTQQNETETKRRLIRLSGAIERRFFFTCSQLKQLKQVKPESAAHAPSRLCRNAKLPSRSGRSGIATGRSGAARNVRMAFVFSVSDGFPRL